MTSPEPTSPAPRHPPDPHASNAEKVRWVTVLLLEYYDYLNALVLRRGAVADIDVRGGVHGTRDAIYQANAVLFDVAQKLEDPPPIPMLLWCPECGERHVDDEERAPHALHACQHCGLAWRPAIEKTLGVRFLPGFKDATPPRADRLRLRRAT